MKILLFVLRLIRGIVAVILGLVVLQVIFIDIPYLANLQTDLPVAVKGMMIAKVVWFIIFSLLVVIIRYIVNRLHLKHFDTPHPLLSKSHFNL
ncbi:MAG: hypothetical protein KU38_12770 [Sulfurovum sp. FS08-3]|nr:MAG: hypothetical protein KU38_12770 [Sulfurovum sp. FS08-3]